eukprot:3834959-Lingulodinium_polyedra.AAC.1
MAESAGVVDLLKLSCKPSTSLQSESETTEHTRLLLAAKRMLVGQSEKFIQEADHQPLLVVYSNDGTEVKYGVSIPFSSGKPKGSKPSPAPSAPRGGQRVVEVLVQQAFL